MTVDLLLVGNGPGELTGWIHPVASVARQLAPTDLRLTLVLSPTQFAGGREVDVVKSWALFDHIVTPPEVTRLVLGVGTIPIGPQASVIHLGGDLWFSARIARRLGAPAGAFAETPLILRRHQAFVRIFAASEDLAAHLRAHGVSAERITVTGDPRVDAVLGGPHPRRRAPLPSRLPMEASASSAGGANAGEERVAILAGSRDRYFRALIPYFMRAASAIATRRPGVTFDVITAEFLSPEVITAMQQDIRQRWPELRVVCNGGPAGIRRAPPRPGPTHQARSRAPVLRTPTTRRAPQSPGRTRHRPRVDRQVDPQRTGEPRWRVA